MEHLYFFIFFEFLVILFLIWRYEKVVDKLTNKIMSQSYGEYLIGENNRNVNNEVDTFPRGDLEEAEIQLKRMNEETPKLEKRSMEAAVGIDKAFGS